MLAGCSNPTKSIQVNIYKQKLPMISFQGYWSFIDNEENLYTWGYDERNGGAVSGVYLGDSLGQGTDVVYNNDPFKIYSNVAYIIRANRGLTNDGEIIEWAKLMENDLCMPHSTKNNIAKVGMNLYLTRFGELYAIPTEENVRLKEPYENCGDLVLTGVIDFAIGYKYIALKEDGSVWTFLVSSMTGEIVEKPKKLVSDVVEIFSNPAIDAAMLLLKSDGSLWSYGGNEYGQCGNGEQGDLNLTTYDCIVSKPYKLAENVRTAWVSTLTTFFLTEDNKLYACGKNPYDLLLTGNGQMLSDEYPKYISTPILVMDNVKQMEYSDTGIFILKTDNTLWTWGYSDKGTLGNGVCYEGDDLGTYSFSVRLQNGEAIFAQPVQIMNEVERLFTETTGLHFAQKTDGTIWYWGYGEIYVNEEDNWDTEIQKTDATGETIFAYQKHYIIPTPIEFSIDSVYQDALNYIAEQGIDTSQYEAVRYINE